MVRRLAAVSALVLAGLALSPAARAQGFFSFYETSPRDVVDRLYDQGYSVHLPMIRRGDVYVVDAVSSSRRPMRLIVSVRDGRVMERYAAAPRISDDRPRFSHWHDDEADRGRDDSDEPRWERRTRTALGDPADLPPRVRNRDSDFEPKPVPPAALTDEPDKPRHHAKKHAPVVREAPDILPKAEPPVAAVAPLEPKPAAVEAPAPAKAIEIPQAKATPKPEPRPEPSPSPTSQVKLEDRPAPRVIPLTKPSPAPSADARFEGMPAPRQAPASGAKIEDAPKPAPTTTQARTEEKPAPTPTPKPSPSAQAKAEDKPKAEAAPVAPRKKLNDLPVGTLD